MPDQNAAASEHAIMQEIRAPLAALPDDPVSITARPGFPLALRGYRRDAVDDYVKRTSQLVAELHAARSPEIAVRRALERVGEDVAGVLGRAHETAERITEQSREEAEERMAQARRDAERITASARRRLQELDAETDRVWVERSRVVEDLCDLAEELLRMADSAAERAPAAEDDASAADERAEVAGDGASAADEQAQAAEQPGGGTPHGSAGARRTEAQEGAKK